MVHLLRTVSSPTEGLGQISFIESERDIPFALRRVYYSYGAKTGCVRGGHAHKTLSQLLVCPFGAIEVSLDNGLGAVETVVLNAPDVGLAVGPALWHTMRWLKDDSVLLVLASDYYDESDYIRDYGKFLLWAKERGGA